MTVDIIIRRARGPAWGPYRDYPPRVWRRARKKTRLGIGAKGRGEQRGERTPDEQPKQRAETLFRDSAKARKAKQSYDIEATGT